MRVLTDEDVAEVLDLAALLPVVKEALRKQGRGAVERPDRPHFPVGTGLDGPDPQGTGLTMPAYVHGAEYFATKLVAVHEDNPERGLPTVNAQIALTDARTGQPAASMAGNRVTNARTGCIGGLAARHLASEPVTLGVIGAGTQARWQTRAVAAATDLGTVRIYSPSDSREQCAADLRDEGVDALPVASARDAVRDAEMVVTATTATEPVFPGEALSPGTLVVAVGAYTPSMRELDDETVSRAAELFADVPEEAVETGDFPSHDAEDLTPLSAVFEGDAGRTRDDETLVVASVGSAVLDAAAAEHLYERAVERNVGREVTP